MQYLPIKGKTYTLFGIHTSTDYYYNTIAEVSSLILREFPNSEALLNIIRHENKQQSYKRKYLKYFNKPDHFVKTYNNKIEALLSEFIYNVNEHLQQLSLSKIFEKSLFTTESQYYLKMIEIEILNRLCKEKFKESKYRIALLPHCLRDLSKECKSKFEGYDYVCKGCSQECYISLITKLLTKYNIDPYIWKTINIKKLFRKLKLEHGNFAVLGIACIPELISGMEQCIDHEIPVIGLPLDANRCIRWMGEFHNNSINLERLELLVK